MKMIRHSVFETNSSSSHSLTLEFIDRKSTKVDKLEKGKTYYYQPLGSEVGSKKYTKVFTSEYEKLCVMCDLLWSYFYSEKQEHFELTEKEYQKRKETSLSRYECKLEKVYKAFTHSVYFESVMRVAYEKGFTFIIKPEDLLHTRLSKYNKNPITDDLIEIHVVISLIHQKFALLKEKNYIDLLKRVVFDPSIILRYTFKKD